MGLFRTALKGTLGSILKVTFMKKLFNYNSTVINKVGNNPSLIIWIAMSYYPRVGSK